MAKIWNEENLKKLLGEDYPKIIKGKLKGKIFIFDKESWEEYQKFRNDYWVDIESGYLIGEQKNNPDHFIFFHEWLVGDKLKNMRADAIKSLEVHHTLFSKRINIKKFLEILTRTKHKMRHGIDINEERIGGYQGKRLIDDEDKLNEYLDTLNAEIFLNEDIEK